MAIPTLFLVLSSIPILPLSFSSKIYSLDKSSSLSPSDDVVISSQNELFSAGFRRVGENAYCFAIWFTEELHDGKYTIVWMANRDQPVNGKNTKFSLLKSGELVLLDAGQVTVWRSSTRSVSDLHLELKNDGNLVLRASDGEYLWQSFDSPTDTLLPQQLFTRNTKLVSSRSKTDCSSGFYKLYFDNDNILRLLYDGSEITSVFWPTEWLNSWEAGRSTYNNSKVAVLDASGYFESSDKLNFTSSDYGVGPQRRLTLDVDGNVRVYSLDTANRSWKVSWQAISQPCSIHGVCGSNSICSYTRESGRRCSCLPGYRMKNHRDWSEGCESDFMVLCKGHIAFDFLKLSHVEFYGYDSGYFRNYTYDNCVNLCLQNCNCRGFQYKFDRAQGFYSCFPKTILYNGYRSSDFKDPMFIRLPKVNLTLYEKRVQEYDFHCSLETKQLVRSYYKKQQYGWLKPLIWATCIVGAFEILCLLIFLFKTRARPGADTRGYLQVATGFKKFTYAELKKATKNFREEIGRGGGGIVYKGKLSDNRIAAIKRLVEANHGEAEFQAEVSTIGKLNHMNLIEIWGYCVEGKHRLLVYEYMEHGSLAKNLCSNKLDWTKRYQIAVGTAKGLAYLHEECLEWVLHCDVKPQNILLNSDYQPKVADFGLSKLLNRSKTDNSSFSRIRGTRGYMAPEWIFNLPITSKVDVYSYGIVILEMITGKSPIASNENNVLEQRRLVTWVREQMHEVDDRKSWIWEIADPALNGEFDMDRMETLIKVALQCVEEDRDARPTMSQLVDELLRRDKDDQA